jgi:hypothetical protein
MSGSISRIRLATRSGISTLPQILQAPSKAIHAATCGIQDVAMTIFSVDSQHSQEGSPYKCNVPILQKSYSLWPLKHSSAYLHPPDLNGYNLTEDKIKLISFGCTPSSHICWHKMLMFKGFHVGALPHFRRYSFQTQYFIFCTFASVFPFCHFLSFFIKRSWKKNHTGLYLGEGFENIPFQIFDLFPWPTSHRLGSQIQKGLFLDPSPILKIPGREL